MDTKSKSPGKRSQLDIMDQQSLWMSAFRRSGELMTPGVLAFEDLQAAAQKWMAHRLEDFQSAVDASGKMAECKDFAHAAAIQQKWFVDCTQRLVTDWTALLTQMSARRSRPDADADRGAE